MTFRSIRLSRVLAAILCAGVMSAAVSVSADEIDNRRGGGYGMMGQGYGPGMMGQGYGPGMMGQGYGPGMMGQGYGPGMMGQGYGMGHGPGMMYGWGQDRDLKLKADDARALVQARLVMLGNDRLTVGDVADDNADEIVVDVVTAKEKALVEKLAVDRATGRIRPVR
ncbi:MAG: hypothetical protein JJ855_14805 [Rhodospirillales bacterium]|nr:hypothetical protein [Rhodospirillales bacterium]